MNELSWGAVRPDEISELKERAFHYRIKLDERIKQREVLENLDIAKAYIDGRIRIAVTLNDVIVGNIKKDFGNPVLIHHKLTKLSGPGLTIWKLDFDLSNFCNADNWREDLVLIENIQAVQAIEEFAFPGFVSFEGDEELSRIRNGCFYSSTRGFIIGLGFTEGEGGFTVAFTSRKPLEFPHSMIEGCPEVVNSIANTQGEIWRNRIADVVMNIPGVRIGIFANVKMCLVALTKPVDYPLDIFDVCIGPFNLEESAVKHIGLAHEEETEDQEGCGNPHSEARRLLQGSEEGRHAVTDQRHEVETAQTSLSHRRGGYTATHTHSGNPANAS